MFTFHLAMKQVAYLSYREEEALYLISGSSVPSLLLLRLSLPFSVREAEVHSFCKKYNMFSYESTYVMTSF